MNIMDNSPIEVPTVGRIVTETYEVEQLKDCHLHLLPSNNNAFADKANEVFKMLIDRMGIGQLLNEYQFESLHEELKFDNQPDLCKAIKEDKSNFIMPLYTPSKSEKQYLIVSSEEKDLFTHIPLMIYTSERVSKYSIMEQMKWYGQDNPKEICDFINEEVDTDAFWN